MDEPVNTASMEEEPSDTPAMARDRPRSMSTSPGDLPMVIADNPFD
jgi:hypothetical protein